MNNPFCLPPLLMAAARHGSSAVYSSGLPSRTGHISPPGKGESAQPAPQRLPIIGEALIDADGVVWLVEALEDNGAGYVTNVARVTQTEPEDPEPTSHQLCRAQFEAFCRNKGIVLRGG